MGARSDHFTVGPPIVVLSPQKRTTKALLKLEKRQARHSKRLQMDTSMSFSAAWPTILSSEDWRINYQFWLPTAAECILKSQGTSSKMIRNGATSSDKVT